MKIVQKNLLKIVIFTAVKNCMGVFLFCYCGTPLAFHITITNESFLTQSVRSSLKNITGHIACHGNLAAIAMPTSYITSI